MPPAEPPRPSLSTLVSGLREADATFARSTPPPALDARVIELTRQPAVATRAPWPRVRVVLAAGAVAGAAAVASLVLGDRGPSDPVAVPGVVPDIVPNVVAVPPSSIRSSAQAVTPEPGAQPGAQPGPRAEPPPPVVEERPVRARSNAEGIEVAEKFDLTAEIRAAEDLALAGHLDEADARLRRLMEKTSDVRARSALSAERVILRARSATGNASVCQAVEEHRAIAGALDEDLALIARAHDCQ